MVFCFGICLALHAVFSTQIYLQHIAQPVESDRTNIKHRVCPPVRCSVVSRVLTLQPLGIDLCSFKI